MTAFIGFCLCFYGGLLILTGIKELSPNAVTTSRVAFNSLRTGTEAAVRQASTGKPGAFAQAQIGQKIHLRHPKQGERVGRIEGTIKYAELWQKRKATNEPWVPTGNLFTAHWLGDQLLYAWKDNLWLLDTFDNVTDAEIKQNFLPAARRFGESDETARVNFAYPPGSWLITDIGKFRVRRVEGGGLRMQADADGRFIHAEGGTGLEGQALVIEDYLEGGGGRDTVWRGWRIQWDDVLKITG